MLKSILLSLVVLLTGCATKPVIQERIEYVFVKVPASLTERVSLSAAPFTPEYYSTQIPKVQEELLFGVIAERTKEIGVCNSRLLGVNNWSAIQDKIYLTSKKE